MQSEDADYQQDLMMAIQTVMQRFQDAPEIEQDQPRGHDHGEIQEQLEAALREKEFMSSKLLDMERENETLREEKEELQVMSHG
jgi:hypothetical protein